MDKRLRKSFGGTKLPSTVALMRLIETQSKATIANRTLDYAENRILPIFKKY